MRTILEPKLRSDFVLLVVDPELLINGFTTPGSAAAKLLALFDFTAAATAVEEAVQLASRAPGSLNGNASQIHAAAMRRWAAYDESLPQAVTDDWELVTYEPLLLEIHRIVRNQPELGLDARETQDRARRLTSHTALIKDVKRLRADISKAGMSVPRLAEIALAIKAPVTLVTPAYFEDRERRFARMTSTTVEFGDRTTELMTISHFEKAVLPFSLDLVRDFESAA